MSTAASATVSTKLPVRDRCLIEATRLFAADGFAGTSLSGLAKAVGVTKASLLHHFPSKDALRSAVIDELLERWKEVIPRALMAAAGGKPRFEAIMGEVVYFFAQDSSRARLLVRECLDRPEEMQGRLRRQLVPYMGLVTEAIEQGQREGRIHEDLDPEAWVAEVAILSASHFAMDTVSRAIAPEGAHDADPNWTERQVTELLRIAQISLFKPRPKVPARPAEFTSTEEPQL